MQDTDLHREHHQIITRLQRYETVSNLKVVCHYSGDVFLALISSALAVRGGPKLAQNDDEVTLKDVMSFDVVVFIQSIILPLRESQDNCSSH